MDLESAGGEVRVIAAQPDGRRGNGVVDRWVGIMSTRTSTPAAPVATGLPPASFAHAWSMRDRLAVRAGADHNIPVGSNSRVRPGAL
jgi:hypothetical protein